MRVAIGILTCRNPELLASCLDSVRSSQTNAQVSVHVCENSGEASGCSEVRTLCDRAGAGLLVNDNPMGLAACWNRLVDSAGPHDVHVILNDDVELVDHAVDAMADFISMNPQAGVVCLAQIRGCKRDQLVELGRPIVAAPFAGDVVSVGGYCFAVSRANWQHVGRFDERFWHFYEDVDYGTQSTYAGLVNYELSQPRVYHRVGATMARTQEINASRMAESRKKYLDKWWPRLFGEGPLESYPEDSHQQIGARLLAARSTATRPSAFRSDYNPRVVETVDLTVAHPVYP